MEDMMLYSGVPDGGMCACDREVFERVWRRVMPEGAEDCPIELRPEPEGAARVQEEPNCGELALPEPTARRTSEYQIQPDTLCLGQASARYAPLLQEMIDGETEDWRLYQTLARRAVGSGARMLGSMAADERRHVRRLAAAYFLITGERCQAQGQQGSRPVPDLMAGLREQFIQEQRSAAAYQGVAAECADPCLQQLYRELAQEEEMHARLIRNLLEQM